MSDDKNDELGDFEPGPLTGEDDENDEEQVERKAQNAVGKPADADEGDEEEQDLPDAEDALEHGEEISRKTYEQLEDLQGRVEEVEAEVERLEPVDEQNPIDLDPRPGNKDICFDRAKPGAKVYVVDVLAESVPEYYEEFPDAPALDDYAGNVVTRFRDADAVFACVYVKDSLTSVDTNITAYPMPESRLTRFPAEQATMVGSASAEFERTDLPEDS